MVWLYLPPEAITHATNPSSDCLCARAQADLISDCTSPSLDIGAWVTLSGKATLRPRSWRGWKTRPWIARLSGMTLPALTAHHGAAWWISSMAAIHASHSPLPENNSVTEIHAISGRTLPALSVRSNPNSASLKTSQDIYDWGLHKSTMTFDQWVAVIRHEFTDRPQRNALGHAFF